MTRTNREIKNDAKQSLKGNLGISLLGQVTANAIFAVASTVVFGGILVNGALQVGVAGIFTRNTDHVKPSFGDLFDGFRENFGENFLMGILKGLFLVLWSLLFVIPGIVKSYSYAMTEYLMARDRELTAMEAIQMSRELMHGNKMRLFLLNLSFLGWILLTIVTFGIAAIYVGPYMRTAKTEFFNDIYFTE